MRKWAGPAVPIDRRVHWEIRTPITGAFREESRLKNSAHRTVLLGTVLIGDDAHRRQCSLEIVLIQGNTYRTTGTQPPSCLLESTEASGQP